MSNDYNSDGRLPIHEAAFRNYDGVIDRMIKDLILRDQKYFDDDEEKNLSDEEFARLRRINPTRIQELVEAVTFDYFRLTPLLAATVGNGRESIDCLIKHGAKLNARDGDNRTMAMIVIFRQNIELFLYLSSATYAPELDLWNTLVQMFTSKSIEDCSAAGRLIEQLTSPAFIDRSWPNLSALRITEKTIQVFHSNVSNDADENLIVSCLLIFYNLFSVDGNIRSAFVFHRQVFKSLVEMKKSNDVLRTMFYNVVSFLCDDSNCVEIFVEFQLIEHIGIFLEQRIELISNDEASKVFEVLAKIAQCGNRFQNSIQNSSASKTSILDQSIRLLERFERNLTNSILHFIQEFCFQNEQQQLICAANRDLIANLLSILDSTYREVQRAGVDTLQMIVTQNTISQLTIIQLGGVEQLLTLLKKATLPRLRVAIICTLWSMTGEQIGRRQAIAYAIGASKLVEFLNIKVQDQLFYILDAIGELLRRVPTINENLPVKLGRRHCVPPMVRILAHDNEDRIMFKCLRCIQKLCLLPTLRSCRSNQTVFQKANGFNQILLLLRRHSQNKYLQARAIGTLACAIFDHQENKEIISKSVVQQLIKRIGVLLSSPDEDVRAEAGSALVILVSTDAHFFQLASEMISLDLHHFQLMINSERTEIRCHGAFQLIRLIRLIGDNDVATWTGKSLLVLFEILVNPKVKDEEKVFPTELIGRLAHNPKGFGFHKHSGLCEAIIESEGLEHLISLLDSFDILLYGNASATIECLVKNSPEGQRRLLKQCRAHPHYLDILRNYIIKSSPLRPRIDELYATFQRKPVHLPSIRISRNKN